MHTEEIIYECDGVTLHGFCAFNDTDRRKRPLVLVGHDWTGRDDFVENKAIALAELGYVGFAWDLYGKGQTGNTNEEKMSLMQPLVDDRTLLLSRIQAALDAGMQLDTVDTNAVAAIGFCLGGLCVLDLARSGANINAVVSFHGRLTPPDNFPHTTTIPAKVLVLHGYDDPMATPDTAINFANEMTAAKADWQLHMYGNTKHSFTNPKANDHELGTVYSEIADSRSWVAMKDFLEEAL